MGEVEWPFVGDEALVKCSDFKWRRATCAEDRGGLTWVFEDGARRYVDTSTARPVTEAER